MLKGALIFAAWGAPLAPDRDVDLLDGAGHRVADVLAIVRAICARAAEPDGMDFDFRARHPR